ncbi:MAG: helix-turn-helix transcriptional regulator [Treponema sp.]|nr:helix-turn-helix transcriptional regulator [Treponema sp.]
MFLYEKFQKLLREREVTSYRVAKDTGLYATLFSDWKSGRSIPKADKIKILAEYFDVSIEYFLEER